VVVVLELVDEVWMYLPLDMDSPMMVAVTKTEVDAAVAEAADANAVEEDEILLLEVVGMVLELVHPAHTP
jgi:hypothetical protein